MLKGLEIKEKLFSSTLENKDFRIDSQFYTKEPIKNPLLKYDKIGNLLENAQYGISISMNEDGDGYPIYRMNEIHNMLCDIDVSKYAKISSSELQIFKLNDRDVLFNRTNSFEWVGRTGLYRRIDDKDFVFASYLVRFIPNEDKLLPEYLTAFLNTKYGIWDIKRRARQSINQTNVNPEEVKAIEIPLLSLNFQKLLKQNFDLAHRNRINSLEKYTFAEDILLEELGLKDFEPKNEPVNIKSFKESFLTTGRLDAEYYQKKYEELLYFIEKKTQWEYLKNLTSYINNGNQPPYSENGEIKFFSQKWIKDKEIDYSFLKDENEPRVDKSFFEIEKNKSSLIYKGDILYYSVGANLGYCHNYLADEPIAVGSFINIIRADKTKINEIYLGVVLNSFIGRMQAEREKSGVAQPYIYAKNLRMFKIPLIDASKQQEIAELVEQSFALKKQSEELLEVAKRAVEIAIEQNEEKAIKFIK